LPLQTKGLTEAYVGLTGRRLLHACMILCDN
jgi:hypothetical protein